MKRRLKINGAIIFFVVLLIALFPGIFFRQERIVYFDEIAEIIGVASILLGQIFWVSGRGYKAEHSSDGHILIQGGPYALVRNPMYLGILLIGIGIVFMLFNWLAVGIFLFVFIIRYLLLIFKEEKKLLMMFPREYATYCKKVPRILPSMRTLSDAEISAYLPLKLAWLKKEIGSILAVLLITVFLESWEDIRNGGLKAYLGEGVFIVITIVLFMALVIYLHKRTTNRQENVSDKSKNNL